MNVMSKVVSGDVESLLLVLSSCWRHRVLFGDVEYLGVMLHMNDSDNSDAVDNSSDYP